MDNKAKITRRNVLKTAPVAVLPLVLGTAQANEPDTELLALFDKWNKQVQIEQDLKLKLQAAEDAALDAYPQKPETPDIKKVLNSQYRPTIFDYYENKVKNQNAIESWKAECQEIDQKCWRELEYAYIDAGDDRGWIEEDIRKIPAQSMTGIIIKLKVWGNLGVDCDDFYDGLVGDVLEDAQRLSGTQGAV